MTTKAELKPKIKISEAAHQKVVVEWASYHTTRHPCLEFLYAIPNEGQHKVQYRVHQKQMGVKSGVPDLCLPYPQGERNGLYIEMKTKGGKASANQKRWLSFLLSAGYEVKVCWSADEAIQALKDYLVFD